MDHSQPISAWVQECSPRWSVIQVPVPLEHQADWNHCGPAVVSAVLASFDERMFQNEAAAKLGTDPIKGTFHERMTQLLQDELSRRDFAIREEQLTVESLKQYLDQGAPVICFLQAWAKNPSTDYRTEWRLGHAVVAVGSDGPNILFMDPWVRGQYAYLPIDELEVRWHYRSVDAKRDFNRLGIVIVPPSMSRKEGAVFYDTPVLIR